MAWEPTELEQLRLQKLERLRSKGIDPFPRRVKRTHTTAEAVAALEKARPEDQPAVMVCGRLRSFRAMGKIAFAHIEDESGRLQLFLRNDQLGEAAIKTLSQDLDLGDFVEAGGVMVYTRTGEPSVLADSVRLLAKAVSPLPVIKEQELDGQIVRYSAFSDVEERFRQRYADLASNPDVRQVFRTRAKVIAALRQFMDEEGFLEVETPILQPIYGGAAARPFTTHHNQLHQDLYLRISFELYLKRLLVGMYDRVYEIGRDFRNEGVSQVHNPEFTQLEFYAAYIDYHGVMDLTERMIGFVAEKVIGGTTIQFQGNPISLARPWRRVTLRQAIKDSAGIDYAHHPTADGLAAAMRAVGHRPDPKSSWGKLVDSLLGTHVQPGLVQPTFVLDYPRDVSPLAKTKPDDPTHVERFEFFIAGMEMGNAFTEINDPLDQEQRFLEMGRLYGTDDEESHPMDEDYLRAMRYGMPPCGGFGTGVDRLVMLFTDQRTIREVLLFPHLRSRE